eukprot:6172563-Pleurochrysis_carterae.AAC.1
MECCWHRDGAASCMQEMMVTAIVAALALPVTALTGGPLTFTRPQPPPRFHLRLQAPATETIPPIPSNGDPKLLALANEFVHTASGFYSPPKPELIADDFVFRGPEVGPLTKEDYLIAMDTFKMYRAFPDIKPNPWGFTADPENPRRIWFFVRNSGTQTGPLGLGYGLEFPPSNKAVQGAPEAFSLTFDDEDRVRHLTVGYVTDRFQGNTGGARLLFKCSQAILYLRAYFCLWYPR